MGWEPCDRRSPHWCTCLQHCQHLESTALDTLQSVRIPVQLSATMPHDVIADCVYALWPPGVEFTSSVILIICLESL